MNPKDLEKLSLDLVDWFEERGIEPPEALSVLGLTAQAMCYACGGRASDVGQAFVELFTQQMRKHNN